jgi:hypothetical protein
MVKSMTASPIGEAGQSHIKNGTLISTLIDAENMMNQRKSANQSAKISVPFLMLLEYAIALIGEVFRS